MGLWVVQKHYWLKSNLHGLKPDVLFTLNSARDGGNLPRLENWFWCCRSSLSHPCGRSMMRVEWKVLRCLTDMFLAFSWNGQTRIQTSLHLVISRHLDLESYHVIILLLYHNVSMLSYVIHSFVMFCFF